MNLRPIPALAAALSLVLAAGCNPTYNWRDYASPDAPYKVMFPAKPATVTRSVDLDGLQVPMTMTAAEVEGVTFAVGTAEAPDPARARAALDAMRLALARNVGVPAAKAPDAATAADAGGGRATAAIDAIGARSGTPVRLVGRFEASGKRFYQVIVVGPAAAMPADQVDQFLTSFTAR
jgi:hypothetical protein